MPANLQWNSKVVAISVIAGVIILYAGSSVIRMHQKRNDSKTRVASATIEQNRVVALNRLSSQGKGQIPPPQGRVGQNQASEFRQVKDKEFVEKKRQQYNEASDKNIGGKSQPQSQTQLKYPTRGVAIDKQVQGKVGAKTTGRKMSFRASDVDPTKAVKSGYMRPAQGTDLATVKIEEKYVDITTSGKQVKIFYREVHGEKIPLLLLHGMSFKSQDWVDVETMQMAGRMGHRVVAIDLPGFGNSKDSHVSDKGTFLADFIRKLDLVKPVIVSPSMSGSFALPYILKQGGPCEGRVGGYIPIAPVNAGKFLPEEYKACSVPVLIVYGSKDKNLGEGGAKYLQNFENHKVFVMHDAGHACWKNEPEIWNTALYNFLSLYDVQKKE